MAHIPKHHRKEEREGDDREDLQAASWLASAKHGLELCLPTVTTLQGVLLRRRYNICH